MKRPGFSLMELLVVIAIIAMLISLLLPAVQEVRQAAARMQCANNLSQIAKSIHSFHDVYKFLPPGRAGWCGEINWPVFILPYIDQANSFAAWDLTLSYYNQPASFRQTQVPVFFCPARRSHGGISTTNPISDKPETGCPYPIQAYPGALGDYGGVMGNNTKFYNPGTNPGGFNGPNANGVIIMGSFVMTSATTMKSWRGTVTLLTVTDGTSSTLMLGEKHVPVFGFGQSKYGDGSVFNGDPENLQAARTAGYDSFNNTSTPLAPSPLAAYNYQFGSYHKGVCQFAMCDGSVRPIAISIDDVTLGLLASRNDGQPVVLPD